MMIMKFDYIFASFFMYSDSATFQYFIVVSRALMLVSLSQKHCSLPRKSFDNS